MSGRRAARANSGRTFRPKGIASKQGAGDLLVAVEIMLPENRDPECDELMRQWRDGKPCNPRKDIE
jgi:DnaJ-class molecular chaperone